MQKKKMEQKTLAPKKAVIEHEDLLDLEDPDDPVQADGVALVASSNEPPVENADEGKETVEVPAVTDIVNVVQGVDVSAATHEASVTEVDTEGKPDVIDAKDSRDETGEQNV